MKTEAAVLWQPGEPVEILEVDLASPRQGEVLVKIAACGVCASDLHVVDGELQSRCRWFSATKPRVSSSRWGPRSTRSRRETTSC